MCRRASCSFSARSPRGVERWGALETASGCVEASPVQASGPEALADIPVWRPEVRDQGVSGLGPPAVRQGLSRVPPSLWGSSAVLGPLPCGSVTPALPPLSHGLSLCVSLLLSRKDSCHWIKDIMLMQDDVISRSLSYE